MRIDSTRNLRENCDGNVYFREHISQICRTCLLSYSQLTAYFSVFAYFCGKKTIATVLVTSRLD